MSYEDQEGYELCGVSYKATRQQANIIMARVMQTKEWFDYATTSDRMREGRFDATSPEGARLVEARVRAYRAAYTKTLEIVRSELGPEAA